MNVNNNILDCINALKNKDFEYMIKIQSSKKDFYNGIPFKDIENYSHIWDAKMLVDGMNFLLEHQYFYKVNDHENVGMACFLQKKISKFVIVIPGGGYSMVAHVQEGYPVAKALYEKGYHVFVLNYSVGTNAIQSFDDLNDCISIILSKQKEWMIDIKDYMIVGFSAGAHLAAGYCTKILNYTLPKPAALVLGYPVITMHEYTHIGSRDNLLGNHIELYDMYSIEKNIDSSYPKVYVWQCDKDNSVSIENSRLLVEQLKNYNIEHYYRTYPSTVHGYSLGTNTIVEGWLEEAIELLEEG